MEQQRTVIELKTDTVNLTSDGSAMPAYVARPASDGNGRGLILFQEAFGVNDHIKSVANRFARAGYTVIAPALFHRTDANFIGSYTDFPAVMAHYGVLTTAAIESDARAAYEWLKSADGVGNAPIASTGYCLGGKASFIANSILPLNAAVSYYGGGIAPDLLDRAAAQHAPIVLFWGGLDQHITPDKVYAAESALRAAGKNYATITFGAADHGFFCDARASYEPNAAAQAWALTLAFYDTYMG